MSSFLVILLCLLHGSVANCLTLNCSESQACLGDVIRCQCQDYQTTLLRWRVTEADMKSVEFDMSSNSSVESPTINGLYSAILNSTNPFSSQLTITLMTQKTELTVQCTTASSELYTTIHIIEAPSRQPTNLQVRVVDTVVLWWDPPMSETTITGYLISITELVTGLTQQLNSTSTSVTTQLNTAGEYLVQVVAVNCAGASNRSDPIQFKLTGHMLQIINANTEGSTGTSDTPTSSTSSAGSHLSWEIGVIGAGIIIALLFTAICVSVVIVVLKRKGKSQPQDSTAPDQGDRYRHIIERTERTHHHDQGYTLNQLASDNKEDDEDADDLDYCTVRGAQCAIIQPAAAAAAEFSGGYTLIGPDPSYEQIRVNNKDLMAEYAAVRKTAKPVGKLPKQVTTSPEKVPDILTTIVVDYNEESSPPQVPPYNAGAATPSASPAENYYDEVEACYDEVGEKMGTPPFPSSPHFHI